MEEFYIGALRVFERLRLSVGVIGGPSSLPERPNKEKRADERKTRCNPAYDSLPFGGICSPYLLPQIVFLMLVGFGFACISVRGITWALDHPNRQRRRLGWVLAFVGFIAGLICYEWALLGHPLRCLGLA